MGGKGSDDRRRIPLLEDPTSTNNGGPRECTLAIVYPIERDADFRRLENHYRVINAGCKLESPAKESIQSETRKQHGVRTHNDGDPSHAPSMNRLRIPILLLVFHDGGRMRQNRPSSPTGGTYTLHLVVRVNTLEYTSIKCKHIDY